ncbi:large conductance mechanosensitive channel protein MscL [uncultured Tessaracoccus sp.]|uniref:large conductance mechanosensitive channel protein MscL n=1 Tax=uncultured Tessaracoccus sp. TaxID=905023 RepID=UPI0026124D02|nr:large conductance mechanosensitive channel protein MscL [uncultured Tessaracoccus sp.]
MQGFKEFIMRGNLVELAVAFIMGGAFATVVESFTAVIMDLLGKLGGTPNFSSFAPGGISVGVFLTALVSFLILSFVIYFGIVKPYNIARKRFEKDVVEEEVEPTAEEALLGEIRDLLKAKHA